MIFQTHVGGYFSNPLRKVIIRSALGIGIRGPGGLGACYFRTDPDNWNRILLLMLHNPPEKNFDSI